MFHTDKIVYIYLIQLNPLYGLNPMKPDVRKKFVQLNYFGKTHQASHYMYKEPNGRTLINFAMSTCSCINIHFLKKNKWSNLEFEMSFAVSTAIFLSHIYKTCKAQ